MYQGLIDLFYTLASLIFFYFKRVKKYLKLHYEFPTEAMLSNVNSIQFTAVMFFFHLPIPKHMKDDFTTQEMRASKEVN